MPSKAVLRANLSLDGLSVGDAFGQCFFSAFENVTPELPFHRRGSTRVGRCAVSLDE